ncbi:hypothetical protein OIU84_013431 [Salix udensis]|uniref:Complex III subunit VI n=1 Tax=Salix udensis TaxID=889485 RepID=A0AAD6JK05_9ROSI|nr:hypothetical protein OIU84_013431 [Salix udensis]
MRNCRLTHGMDRHRFIAFTNQKREPIYGPTKPNLRSQNSSASNKQTEINSDIVCISEQSLFEAVYNDRCIRETDCCRVLADEELVDPKKYLEDSCKPKCVKPLLEYEACVKRVERDDSGHKHCTGQYFDYWFCIDKCVAPKLFSKLK